jgi:hypothetical protein
MGLSGLDPERTVRVSTLVAECEALLERDAGMDDVQRLLSERGVGVTDAIVVTRELLGAGPDTLGQAKTLVLSAPSRRTERREHEELVHDLFHAVERTAEEE